MTIKIRSEETAAESKFYYHNQDVTYNYMDMIDNGINLWHSSKEVDNHLLPFIFNSFSISNEQDIIEFKKYLSKIEIGSYVAILICGGGLYQSKKLTKAFELVGGGKLIESLSDSNPNFCLIGYRGQRKGKARQIVGDSENEDKSGGISVWMMTTKNRCLFKNKFLIHLRNNLPLYFAISDFYRKHIKKEMINNIYL